MIRLRKHIKPVAGHFATASGLMEGIAWFVH
jgi:hypothetical protein